MPTKVTVSEPTTLKLKLTEGYGIESEGPPPEFGKKIQSFRNAMTLVLCLAGQGHS